MARPGLRNHPKFRRLLHVLKMPAVYVQAHLQAMWEVGYEHGNPILGDATDVELAAEWEDSGREPGQWFDAVCAARWVDELRPGVYQIHDLLDHAPDYVKKRAFRELQRKNKNLREKTADNGGQRRILDANGVPPAPAPTPTPVIQHPSDACPPPARAPEDGPPAGPAAGLGAKSADETSSPDNANGQNDDEAPKTERDPATPERKPKRPPRADDSPVVLIFPVKAKGKGAHAGEATWPLRQAKLAEYLEAYPELDVSGLFRRAVQWCRDNPPKRKTVDGMPNFLTRWLNRELDKPNAGLFQKTNGESHGNHNSRAPSAFTGARRSLPDVVAPRTAEG